MIVFILYWALYSPHKLEPKTGMSLQVIGSLTYLCFFHTCYLLLFLASSGYGHAGIDGDPSENWTNCPLISPNLIDRKLHIQTL